MRLVEAAWEQYRQIALKDTPPEKIAELKTVFFAGGLAVHYIIDRAAVQDDINAKFDLISMRKELEGFFAPAAVEDPNTINQARG